MKLFADLYLDEDGSVLAAAPLRGRGLDAVTAVAEDTLGLDDSAQLAHAATTRAPHEIVSRIVILHFMVVLSSVSV